MGGWVGLGRDPHALHLVSGEVTWLPSRILHLSWPIFPLLPKAGPLEGSGQQLHKPPLLSPACLLALHWLLGLG